MIGPKPLLDKLGFHFRLESCGINLFTLNWDGLVDWPNEFLHYTFFQVLGSVAVIRQRLRPFLPPITRRSLQARQAAAAAIPHPRLQPIRSSSLLTSYSSERDPGHPESASYQGNSLFTSIGANILLNIRPCQTTELCPLTL